MYPSLAKAPCNASNHHVAFTPGLSDLHPHLLGKTILQTIFIVALSILAPMVAHAGSATWDLNPTSGDWNTAANWTPATVPNGPADIATFGLSNISDVTISANTEVNAITFTPANTGYTITLNSSLTLTISGTGITGGVGNFLSTGDGSGAGGTIFFRGSSTADSASIDSIQAGGSEFLDSSTAANATLLMAHGGAIFADSSSADNANIIEFGGADLHFLDNSTAANASIIQSKGAFLEFRGNSTAGKADISTGEDTSFVSFADTSSADNAVITGDAEIVFGDASAAANASIGVFNQFLVFGESSTGGRAQIELGADPVFGGSGTLDISGHNAPGVTIGSIKGDANSFIFLGANNLTVGRNDLSTTFSGVIEDNGFNGSLTKIGSGTLDLTGANTYTGQTNINGGVLQVDGSTSSNTFINHKGILAGAGTVNGNVTNYGGDVSPGDPLGVPGVLTVSNNYMQTPSAGLVILIAGGNPGQASVLNVLGNANIRGALDPELVNGFDPAIGQSFAILSYASVTGSFSHIQNQVFDNGRKRWALVYHPTGASLVVVPNGHSNLSRK